jgi:hypothetical protein
MSTLAIRTQHTNYVNWLTSVEDKDNDQHGLQDLLEKVHNCNFDLGCNNDTDLSVSVATEVFDAYDIGTIAEIIRTKFIESYQLDMMMADLCNRGYLEVGNYIVSVSW